MKNFKLTFLLAIILVGTMDINAQSTFGGFGLETINSKSHFVKKFIQERFQIQSIHGAMMTFHKGTGNGDAKVHIGNDALSFSTASYKLYVEDGILSESLKIDRPQDWSDFVFNENYPLKSISEVADFIKTHHHLPDVPSEAEIKAQGYYDQHEINKVLLQKIEELTLYIIQQNKDIEDLKRQK
jgi:hypothetical protein